MIFSYLKLIIYYFKNLIVDSPVKSIVLFITIMSYKFAGTFDDYPSKLHIVDQFTDGSSYVYVIKKQSSGSINYETIVFEKEIEIDGDGYYHYMSYHDLNVLLWFIFGFGLSYTIAGLLVPDDNWDFKNVWQQSLLSLVSVELEDGIYHYMALGRLIGKSDRSLTYRVFSNFNVHSLRDIYLCPKFETKRVKRNDILSKIGII